MTMKIDIRRNRSCMNPALDLISILLNRQTQRRFIQSSQLNLKDLRILVIMYSERESPHCLRNNSDGAPQ